MIKYFDRDYKISKIFMEDDDVRVTLSPCGQKFFSDLRANPSFKVYFKRTGASIKTQGKTVNITEDLSAFLGQIQSKIIKKGE